MQAGCAAALTADGFFAATSCRLVQVIKQKKRWESTALESHSATAKRDGALSWRGREALAICQQEIFISFF